MAKKTTDRTLAQLAYQQIKDRILAGKLSFGTPLSRRSLAVELGMSLIPITEAIQRLEMDGLVESWPRVGTRVKVPTAQDIRDSVIVREALESQAARLFAERASLQARRELVRVGRDLDLLFQRSLEIQGNGSSFEYHRRHAEFHMRIAVDGGCRGLQQALEKNQVLVLHWLYDTAFGEESPQPATWHEDLARVLAGRDAVKSDEAMRRHVQLGLDDFLRAVEPYSRIREYPLRSPYLKARDRKKNREPGTRRSSRPRKT